MKAPAFTRIPNRFIVRVPQRSIKPSSPWIDGIWTGLLYRRRNTYLYIVWPPQFIVQAKYTHKLPSWYSVEENAWRIRRVLATFLPITLFIGPSYLDLWLYEPAQYFLTSHTSYDPLNFNLKSLTLRLHTDLTPKDGSNSNLRLKFLVPALQVGPQKDCVAANSLRFPKPTSLSAFEAPNVQVHLLSSSSYIWSISFS